MSDGTADPWSTAVSAPIDHQRHLSGQPSAGRTQPDRRAEHEDERRQQQQLNCRPSERLGGERGPAVNGPGVSSPSQTREERFRALYIETL